MLEAPAPSTPALHTDLVPFVLAQNILLSKDFYTLYTDLEFVSPTCVISDKDPVLFPSGFLGLRRLM